MAVNQLELDRLLQLQRKLPWIPQQRQLEAFNSKADVVLYGGSAGGGKSDLLLGMAMMKSHRALLLRREFKQIQALQDRLIELRGNSKDEYAAGEQTWRFKDGRTLELGSCPHPGDEVKFQGRPHDLLLIDEGANFELSQIEFLQGWLRSADGRPCQMVIASNPPLSGAGMWLVDYFGAWVDPNHPNPAKSGEIRYFARNHKGQFEEVSEQWRSESGQRPQSRTFISARLEDNKYLARTGYRATLESLPDELKGPLLDGDFMAGSKDKPLQLIPSAWIREAQSRWRAEAAEGLPLTAVGVDPTRGGRDRAIITLRYRHHIARQIEAPKNICRSGATLATFILDLIGNETPRVTVDVIGIGASVYDHLEPYLGHHLRAHNGAGGVLRTYPTHKPKPANRRAESYWNLRTMLDPASSNLQLPPDIKLFSELCQPTYHLNARGIMVEPKEDIIKRSGSSPDLADSLALSVDY